MKSSKLAILGGDKACKFETKPFSSIGKEELNAASKVIKTGFLSQYLGEKSKEFNGGKYVNLFERKCEKYFKVKNAIVVNSWTSGLIASVGAININPGDEIIVPCWTMCASATAILHWNAIPVFADIDSEGYNIDISKIETKITKRTKAVIVVEMSGWPLDMDKILKIAKKYKLKIISDNAQSIGSKYKNKYTGTISDIGGYSLNYHKTIQCGEGGIIITNNDNFANKMRLIRNHGEAVITNGSRKSLVNIIGYNFRMGEIEAAISIEQLKKLRRLVKEKQKWAKILDQYLINLRGLEIPKFKKGNSSSYYSYPLYYDEEKLKISKDIIFNALKAEGIPFLSNRMNLLYKLPIYKNKIAYGENNFPWSKNIYKGRVDYNNSNCPQAEKLNKSNYLNFGLTLGDFNENKIHKIGQAFEKVWKNLHSLY